MLSEADRGPLAAGLEGQQILSSRQKQLQNGHNFVTLSQISEQEKIEIIQREFQLQAEGKISLKQYYQSTEDYSLFQLHGYNIKYESIRRKKLYQQLKRNQYVDKLS